jgi:dihydrofolate reductase
VSGIAGDAAGRAAPIALVLVAAVADNGVIGRAGGLPWRLKSDMQHFRALTSGKPVVMGRKTYQSIGRPLKDRTNIVITRDPAVAIAGLLVAGSLETALAAARGDALRRGCDAIMVIGGADIYALRSRRCTRARSATRYFLQSSQPLGERPRAPNTRRGRTMRQALLS